MNSHESQKNVSHSLLYFPSFLCSGVPELAFLPRQLTSFHVFDVTITHRPFHSPYVSGFSHFTHSPPLQYNTSNPPAWQNLFYSQSLSICLLCFSEGFSWMWFLAPKAEQGESGRLQMRRWPVPQPGVAGSESFEKNWNRTTTRLILIIWAAFTLQVPLTLFHQVR